MSIDLWVVCLIISKIAKVTYTSKFEICNEHLPYKRDNLFIPWKLLEVTKEGVQVHNSFTDSQSDESNLLKMLL